MTQRRWTVFAFALGWLAVTPTAAQQRVALAPGDPAPKLGGVTVPADRRYDADWTANRLTLVNFWATWCEPCRGEMPLLDELFRLHRERGLDVVGVFERGEEAQVGAFLADVPVSYTVIQPDAITDFDWGGIQIRPTSFLVDGRGTILRRYVGARPEQTEGLFADVQAALDGKPLPAQVLPAVPAIDPEELKRALGRN
jgi:thiol-disulfide isomerase/thioredoxin